MRLYGRVPCISKRALGGSTIFGPRGWSIDKNHSLWWHDLSTGGSTERAYRGCPMAGKGLKRYKPKHNMLTIHIFFLKSRVGFSSTLVTLILLCPLFLYKSCLVIVFRRGRWNFFWTISWRSRMDIITMCIRLCIRKISIILSYGIEWQHVFLASRAIATLQEYTLSDGLFLLKYGLFLQFWRSPTQ